MKSMAMAACVGTVLLAGGQVAADWEERLGAAGKNAQEISAFVSRASEKHGDIGRRAAAFLVSGMPEADLRALKSDFLMENLGLAVKARKEFSWCKDLPEEVFFNDVLPYASLDETREAWRARFYEQCRGMVKDCRTTTEAVQAINKNFFNLIEVHYNTGRKAPNQSPSESIKLGKATCTGLSIILVDACRSVGVPARVAGTPLWSNKRGNHTWTEIYDSGKWFFTGADEYNKAGLNRAWFVGDASKAIANDWRHAIWATSWKRTEHHFPMVWDLENREVPAVNVTRRYAKDQEKNAKQSTVYLRLWDTQGGGRLGSRVELLDREGRILAEVTTRAGTTDLNDMPALKVRTGVEYRLRVRHEEEVRWESFKAVGEGEGTIDLVWSELGKGSVDLKSISQWLALLPEERHLSVPEGALSRKDAERARGLIWETVRKELAEDREVEMAGKVAKAAGKEMKFLERTFGKAPETGRSLWISMHGGGGAPPRVNDQQWQNQIRLYAPGEGIVVAPRAPTDTWNLWHQGHIDDLFDRLIANFVITRGVDPNRVYLMGYSAGGDGVYQLAPRMADRFAAAAMMAGHPNNASPLGLRNLPFMIFMGGKDGAYSRNKVAAKWGITLGELREADPGGYDHKATIYPQHGHWMNGDDREALPWMITKTRDPWPQRVVWNQSGRTHERFYWLQVPKEAAKGGRKIEAEVQGQEVMIRPGGAKEIIVRLSDQLVDLDKVVTVKADGVEVFKGKLDRQARVIWESLKQRPDPRSAATAELRLKLQN
ncbi:MAG TPA: polyhydroxyalkanoate depolymerase [Verrucomicrobiales bacterium]|nr:polyhydroxyalkanoate depolymerase [Verrucomicrobiales bacterium]